MNNKSINWINYVKAFSIIAVFFVHTQNYYGFVMKEINSFVTPWFVNAFFFISGYLLFWKQLSEPKISENRKAYLSKDGEGRKLFFNIVFRIIIPSIIFSIIEFVPSCLIQGHGITLGYALKKTIGGGTYWFTSALAVSELLLFWILCTRWRNIWRYVSVSLCLGIFGLIIVKLDILQSGIWAWRQGLIALIFLALGGVYWSYEKHIDKLMHWWFVLLLLIVFVLIVVGLKGLNSPIISSLRIKPLGFVTSTISCLLLIWLCKRLPEIKILTFIGQNSLGFYFLSGALPISLSLLSHKVISENTVWMMLIIWIVCLVVAYIIVTIINKWLPWMWDLRKFDGKRKRV